MTEKRLGISRRVVALWSAALALVCALVFSSAALAHNPKGVYAPFADCPLNNSLVEECIVAKTETGEFVVGKKTVPIENPITLQGGTHENEVTGALTFYGAEGGETLSHSPQGVPGGLLGLVNCKAIKGSGFLETAARLACEWVFENSFTGVKATTELAGTPEQIGLNLTNLLTESGTALSLPVKVHLENTLLGSECYIGSNAKPVELELTTGTSGSTKGKAGELHILEGGNLLEITKNSLVNGEFAAPEAKGCGGIFASLIDPLVNSELGLPAAAGTNKAILNGTLKQATASAVKESE
jgi:hypothetical protein